MTAATRKESQPHHRRNVVALLLNDEESAILEAARGREEKGPYIRRIILDVAQSTLEARAVREGPWTVDETLAREG